MNISQRFLIVLIATVIILSSTVNAVAQYQDEEVAFVERNLGGPRLAVTFIPGDSKVAKGLEKVGMGQTLSQFGWHFEKLVIPDGGGPSFVIQFTPLIAGVEYGKFFPNATLAFGVRLPNGIEFGMGPNILLSHELGTSTALTLAVGKSFNYGGVSIPIDLAYTSNPSGSRVALIIGYAIAKSSKEREGGR